MNFFVGGKYVSKVGSVVRVIEQIHGADIHWRDQVGPSTCSRETFSRWVWALSPDSPPEPNTEKRTKPITQVAIGAVQKELESVRLLRAFISDVGVQADAEKQALISAGLWQIAQALNWREKSIIE